MAIKNIPLHSLVVNRANDRHGELENETAAIAWLFNTREQHMRNLAKDIVDKGEIYELPLVSPDGLKFIVFDGNRRITCLKLLEDPRRAPTTELQTFFRELRAKWAGSFSIKSNAKSRQTATASMKSCSAATRARKAAWARALGTTA
jgi:hypothetical protein